MDIRFSQDGPAFPEELVDDFINGEVVFLCGAGVGAPQLPLFGGLLRKVYDDLGIEATDGEAEAANNLRFEEAFGSLERRLANPAAMYESVSNNLRHATPHLANHTVLLRLARSLDNRACLITTNFDTFFEHALEGLDGSGAGRLASHAPQSLPSPGGSKFSGIIHLHGRIADESLKLGETALVLTSATYGDAYMRSGWAPRFLFDLLRCKTLVLIGYSAGDAPVRYFLNVLDADRQRFRDIRNVYAFDGVEAHHSQADKRWSALAVTPLAYNKSKRKNHGALWEDLARLATLVESPKVVRRARAAELLAVRFEAAEESEKATVRWLYAGKEDLFDVLIGAMTDPQWLEFFLAERLINTTNLTWILASWCAVDWTDHLRIATAVKWHEKLKRELGLELQRRLRPLSGVKEIYIQTWEAIIKACLVNRTDLITRTTLEQRLRAGRVREVDFQFAIDEIRPILTIREHDSRELLSDEGHPPSRIVDLVSLEMRAKGEPKRLRKALAELRQYAERIMALASIAIRSVLEEAREVELIQPGFDRLDFGVPSVEDHRQNEFRSGPVDLVVLLTALLPEVASQDPDTARAHVTAWRRLPGRLGLRLWLTALKNSMLYSAEDVALDLVALPSEDFWQARREIVLLIECRGGDFPAKLVSNICRRILAEGPNLYAQEISLGKKDWRPISRDREIWLRLAAFNLSGVLPKYAKAALKSLVAKPYIPSEKYEEEDLFSSYTTGVTYISGDATAFFNVEPENRIAQALEQQSAWDPSVQRNWNAYCSADPANAFNALSSSKAFYKNLTLWSDLIGAVSWAPQDEAEDKERLRLEVASKVFQTLDRAPQKIIETLASRLADLWPNSPDVAWWDRIWHALDAKDGEALELEDGERFYDRVINRAPGRLARHLIESIERARSIGNKARLKLLVPRLRVLLSADSKAGWMARGILARHIGFVLSTDHQAVRKLFLPWLLRNDTQGKVLRAILIEMGTLTASATRVFKPAILLGVAESRATGNAATFAAGNLLRPLFSQTRFPEQKWGITAKEVRHCLRLSSTSIRGGAADFFSQAVSHSDMPVEAAWDTMVGPVFMQVWPQEKSLRNANCTLDLAALCVGAGDRFPEAFSMIRHYLHPLSEEWASLSFLIESQVPTKFPSETLELLWLMFGPAAQGKSSDVAELLDRVGVAQEGLSRQRRFQWLEQRAVRY